MRENVKLQMALNARLRSSVCGQCLAKACLSIPSRAIRGKRGYQSVYIYWGSALCQALCQELYTQSFFKSFYQLTR